MRILRQEIRYALRTLAKRSGCAVLGVASLLYETKPSDPAVLAVVLATLFGTAFATCYVPAHRAAKVDPMVVLRWE